MRPGGKRLKRVLIDCSHINFGGQPSGIPRVVLAYVEVGYAWGARNGVEVIPVVPTETGVYVVQPLPGRGVPPALLARLSPGRAGGPLTLASVGGQVLRAAGQWFALSAFHLAYAIISLLNIKVLQRLEPAVRADVERRFGIVPHDTTGRLDAARVAVGPGDLVFCPAYWHDVRPDVYARLRDGGAKVVILVHDILPILFERFYEAPWRFMFRDNVLATFRYADALFCVSSYTGSALKELGAREKAPALPVVTAYNGFEPLADAEYMAGYVAGRTPNLFGNEQLRAVLSAPDAPYVMVGSIEPKKGHVPAIRCFEAMWRGGYPRNLVIIGRRAWMCDAIVAAVETSPFYGSRLFWFHDISDFDLAYAYARCHALAFCSIGEGFGIPMIEAAYFGKPTVVLDTLIGREILGDTGCYFTDARSFVDRVCELDDPGFYERRCALARGLDWPTWDAYAPRVFDALRDVYDGRPVPDVIPRHPAVPSHLEVHP